MWARQCAGTHWLCYLTLAKATGCDLSGRVALAPSWVGSAAERHPSNAIITQPGTRATRPVGSQKVALTLASGPHYLHPHYLHPH